MRVLDNIVAGLGADRVLAPAGALPQPADRLDTRGPVRSHELEVAVERLCLDSTSHRNLLERHGDDPAGRVADVVRARGKMHNPETGSGGVLVGVVAAVGERYPDPPAVGDRVVTLASLTLTPLRLDAVHGFDGAQVAVTGTAYLPAAAPWGPLPDDLPLDVALAVYDVYAAASHTRDLAAGADAVTVLGAGHAGKVALAAARDAAPAATLTAVDLDPTALARVETLCDRVVRADLGDPIGALAAVGRRADLVVNVVNARGCEPAAILLTEPTGRLLLYSMATSFQTAALTADGMSSEVEMLVGNGFAPDRGAYALDLVRRVPALREALG